jgi:uncharacterized membrane protein YraQ (UPF0718 family)/copper chaperone CopZ
LQEIIEQYPQSLWSIMLDLSPALLAGLLLAGILRVFFPERLIRAHMSQPNLRSTLKAALIGVPMPLCSCGVIPTAMGLRNQGASKGATTSFMISTPQTGVDSILVVGSFLGWPFAAFKVMAAFVTGVIGGALVNRFTPHTEAAVDDTAQGEHWQSSDSRLVAALRYALFDILAAIDLWLMVGILLAAAITAAVPPDYLQGLSWTQGLGGMLLVLAIALPLYVCTTSSVPIAASLIAAGMPVGSALVFLMAGPATNIATIGAVYRTLGLRVLSIYLATVIVSSIAFGMTFNFLLADTAADVMAHDHHDRAWWEVGSALLLIGLMLFLLLRRLRNRLFSQGGIDADAKAPAVTLQVEGMTCQHCVANVRRAIESQGEFDMVRVDQVSGVVQVIGPKLQRDQLAKAVNDAGYRVVDEDGT